MQRLASVCKGPVKKYFQLCKTSLLHLLNSAIFLWWWIWAKTSGFRYQEPRGGNKAKPCKSIWRQERVWHWPQAHHCQLRSLCKWKNKCQDARIFFFLLQQVNQTITRIVRILTQPEMTPWVQAGNMCTSRPWGRRQDPHTPVLEPRDSACGPLSFCGSCPPRRRWQFSGNLWFSRKPLATSQTAGVGWAWLGKVVLVGTAQLSTSGSRPDRKRQKIQISF